MLVGGVKPSPSGSPPTNTKKCQGVKPRLPRLPLWGKEGKEGKEGTTPPYKYIKLINILKKAVLGVRSRVTSAKGCDVKN